MSISRPIVRPIARAISRALTGGVQLPQWTFGYNGTDAFGQLTNAWQPTGNNSTILIKAFSRNEQAYFVDNSDSGASGDSFIAAGSNGSITYGSGYSNFKVNGIPTPSGTGMITNQYIEITADVSTSVNIGFIGARRSNSGYLNGQVNLTELNDPDTPANSVKINGIIASELQPTDFDIYNELTGLVIGTLSNGVFELVEGV